MGLDLDLLPFDADYDGLWFSHTVLSCERRRELFDEVMQVEKEAGKVTPYGFSSYKGEHCPPCEETGYGYTKKTPYGQRLQYVTVSSLLPFEAHEGVTDNYKNRAVWAYLKALPPDTKVALYWR